MQPYYPYYGQAQYSPPIFNYTFYQGGDASYSESIVPLAASSYYPPFPAPPATTQSPYYPTPPSALPLPYPYPAVAGDYNSQFTPAAPSSIPPGWSPLPITNYNSVPPATVPYPNYEGQVNQQVASYSSQQQQNALLQPSMNSASNVVSSSAHVLPEANKQLTKQKAYADIRSGCLKTKQLWEDPNFPPSNQSISLRQPPNRAIEWKRPHEICKDPKFVDEQGMSRFDIVQGELGDCWLLAAIANLTLYDELIKRVVPNDPQQSFERQHYCGAFRFFFWQYGEWVEVVVDDRLPTYNGRLVYMHSAAKNEFWSALLEKAYAKLVGCYENLKGGSSCESMTDMTGGFCEIFELKEKTPKTLLTIITKACERQSLMCCSINQKNSMAAETRLTNGLIMGHAYSLTDVKSVTLKNEKVQLLRIRNPWGQAEWNGAFSDSSPQWQMISEQERKRLGLIFESDGEFWMTFNDFVNNFEMLEICNLALDLVGSSTEDAMRTLSLSRTRQQDHSLKCLKRENKWESTIINGEWRRRFNAGGCRNNLQTFWTNPQYRIQLTEVDEHDSEKLCSVLIGLLQKDRRRQKNQPPSFLTIGFSIYKVSDTNSQSPLDMNFFAQNVSKARSAFINLREVSGRFRLPPGSYCIVPSTYEPETEGHFLLRVYSEKKCSANELDNVTSRETNIPTIANTESEKLMKSLSQAIAVFQAGSNSNGVVDAFDLLKIVSKNLGQELKRCEFNLESSRSMMALKDKDMNGTLNVTEFTDLWCDLCHWQLAFMQYDKSRTGYLEAITLRDALKKIGFGLSNKVLRALVTRYSDKNGNIAFNDFISCAIRLSTMLDTFRRHELPSQAGKLVPDAKFPLEDFILTTMYC